MYFGKRIIISKPEDIADEYNKLAQDDLRAAITLGRVEKLDGLIYMYFRK